MHSLSLCLLGRPYRCASLEPLGQSCSFMCYIENQLEQKNMIPSFYRRYVDDTLVKMPNAESATDFLQVLNSVHPSLSFTMELEHEGSIPFLGTVITRCGNTLKTEVYRKPTDTGLLLHFQSHVDNRYKKGLVNTMVDRAYRLSSTEEAFTKECDKLRTTFSKLHYPNTLVNSTIHRFMQENDRAPHAMTSSEPSVYIKLPFNTVIFILFFGCYTHRTHKYFYCFMFYIFLFELLPS